MGRPARPRKIGKHTADDMKTALKNIKNGMSVRKASKLSGIPFTTLRRYFHKITNMNIDQATLTPNYSINKVFNEEQEKNLKDYFTYCALLFYGLSTKECRRIAYQMAHVNNLKMPDSWKKTEMAGKDWLLNFRKRNPELTLRKPEACSLARATAFNRTNVERFYNNLENLMRRHSTFAEGTRIFNIDETSTTTVQKPQKVIAQKGRKNIGKVTSGERGTLVTTCCIIGASGVALPPVMVFPRKNFKNFMIKNTPPGTLGLATPTGWMNCEIFPEVMKHFIKYSNTTLENPSILIMDNHESHLSIEALNIAKASGVHVLTLHPHTSGKLQPLDVGVYGPFKTYYNAGIDAWMLQNPGKPVTIYDVGEIIGNAFLKVMTPINITKAFKACGIIPFDRNLFDDDDFLPSSVTDRPYPDCEPREEAPTIQPPPFQDYNDINIPGPSTKDSFQLAATTKLANSRFSSSSEVTIFEEDVRSVSNLAENVSVTLRPLDNIISLERNDSPSILQESNDREPTPTAYGNSDISGNLISSPPPPPKELVANINPVSFAETASSIVDKKSKIISPFEFRNPIKAGPRKSKRKTRKLGRSLIATDTPEKLEIEMDKNLTKKRKEAKKRKTAKKILQSDSENEELLEIPYRESDEDNDWLDEEVENCLVPITSNYLERPLSHTPQEGEYVLVEFSTKKTQIYYVGKVLESRNKKLEYCISFLRQKSINKFHNPNEPDISYVKEHDIKLILPKPDFSGSTSRQQSYLSFATDLSLLNIR